MNKKHLKVIAVATVAAMGGLLFGFDTGIISGAIPFLQEYFNISESMIENITAAGLVGAIIGAIFSGRLVDIFGRKKIILAVGLIFGAGAAWSGLASSPVQLIIARLSLGVAIGAASFAVPLYIAEIAPANVRGAFVSLFQLMITIGILVSYLTGVSIADTADPGCWRYMFYVGIIPAVLLTAGAVILPETPSYLVMTGRREEARKVLASMGDADTAREIKHIENAIDENRGQCGWKELLKPWLRNAVIIAIGIMFFQQFSGINTIMYYCSKIFIMAGFTDSMSAIWASVGVGAVNVLFSVLAMLTVDRTGRRKLFFIGMCGITVSLALISACFIAGDALGAVSSYITIALVFIYIAFYAMSIGPLGWIMISEVFPLKVRGVGSSLGSMTVWICNSIVAFTFFKIVRLLTVPGSEIYIQGDNLGNPAGAFALYSLIALAGIIWGYFYIPETKGAPLYKIEAYWRNGGKPKDFNNSPRTFL